MTNLPKEHMRQVVRTYILDNFLHGEDEASLTGDVRLVSDGLVDSLSVLKLVVFLEEKFSIKISPQDVNLDNFDTVEAIANLLAAKIGGS